MKCSGIVVVLAVDESALLWVNSVDVVYVLYCALLFLIHVSNIIEGSRPEWSISAIYRAWDTPFWSGTLDMHLCNMQCSPIWFLSAKPFTLHSKQFNIGRALHLVRPCVLYALGAGKDTLDCLTHLVRPDQLSYLPWIKYFGLPVSVSCPVYGNVDDEESLPLVSVSKRCASRSQRDVHLSLKGMRISSVS